MLLYLLLKKVVSGSERKLGGGGASIRFLFHVLYLESKNKIFFSRLTCLETTGKIVPGIIRVNAMCIESENLMSDSAVLGDDVTLGFRIAEFINMYQVTMHLFLL